MILNEKSKPQMDSEANQTPPRGLAIFIRAFYSLLFESSMHCSGDI